MEIIYVINIVFYMLSRKVIVRVIRGYFLIDIGLYCFYGFEFFDINFLFFEENDLEIKYFWIVRVILFLRKFLRCLVSF